MASGTYKNAKGGYTIRTYWSSKMDIAGNFSTVTCDHYLDFKSGWDLYIGTRTLTCTAGEKKSFSTPSVSQGTGGGSKKLGTTTHKVSHDANGKKTIAATTSFNIDATIAGTWYGTVTATGTMVLDDIPRASTATAQNGTLGTAQAFTVTRNDESFSHAITFSCGTVTNNSAVAKTTDLNPKWTPPLSLASQNPTGDKVTVNFTITTYNSAGDAIGTNTFSADYTIPSTVVPTVNLSVTDGKGYLGTYGAYVQGMSTFKVTVSATPIYGAAISSYSTDANGTTYNETSFETAPIINSGTNTITARVTDARGNVGTKSVTANVLEYEKPKIEFTAARCDDNWIENVEGENILIDWAYHVSSLNDKNKVTVELKYSKAGSNEYVVCNEVTNSTTYRYGEKYIITDLDPDSSYEFELSVKDDLSTSAKAVKVPSVFTFLHFDGPTQDGVGKNKLNLIDPPFEINDSGGEFSAEFASDILTLKYTGESSIMMPAIYNIPNVKKGDVIRFKSVLLSEHCRVRIHVTTSTPDSTGTLIDEIREEFYYIDGITETTFEHTVLNDLFMVTVDFYLDSKNTLGAVSASFKNPIFTINEEDMAYERYLIGVEPRLGIGKIAELDNGADFGLKARFNAGLEYPVLRQYTDFNDLLTPNFYIGENVATYQYTNCPITGGTFYLEVVAAGENSYRQSVTTCSKDHSVTYERFYHDGSWGVWRNVYHGQETLYNNASGTAGTVELLYNTKNFTFLDIYFIDNNQKDGGCMRITHPSNKTLNFSMIEDGPSRSWIRRTSYVLSDYALTPVTTHAGYVKLDGITVVHGDIGTNFLRIVRVMGIR